MASPKIYLEEEHSDPKMCFEFRILAMSFLIYSLLDTISADKNYLLQTSSLGYLWKDLENAGWIIPKYHHVCGYIHTIEVNQIHDSGKYISHIRTYFGWIPGFGTPYIEYIAYNYMMLLSHL